MEEKVSANWVVLIINVTPEDPAMTKENVDKYVIQYKLHDTDVT